MEQHELKEPLYRAMSEGRQSICRELTANKSEKQRLDWIKDTIEQMSYIRDDDGEQENLIQFVNELILAREIWWGYARES